MSLLKTSLIRSLEALGGYSAQGEACQYNKAVDDAVRVVSELSIDGDVEEYLCDAYAMVDDLTIRNDSEDYQEAIQAALKEIEEYEV